MIQKELILSNEEYALKHQTLMDNAYFTWFFLS